MLGPPTQHRCRILIKRTTRETGFLTLIYLFAEVSEKLFFLLIKTQLIQVLSRGPSGVTCPGVTHTRLWKLVYSRRYPDKQICFDSALFACWGSELKPQTPSVSSY